MRIKDKLAGCSHIEGVVRKATSSDPNPPKREALNDMKACTCMFTSPLYAYLLPFVCSLYAYLLACRWYVYLPIVCFPTARCMLICPLYAYLSIVRFPTGNCTLTYCPLYVNLLPTVCLPTVHCIFTCPLRVCLPAYVFLPVLYARCILLPAIVYSPVHCMFTCPLYAYLLFVCLPVICMFTCHLYVASSIAS